MYTMNSIGPRTDPLGTLCFNPLCQFNEHMYVCEWLMLLVVECAARYVQCDVKQTAVQRTQLSIIGFYTYCIFPHICKFL